MGRTTLTSGGPGIQPHTQLSASEAGDSLHLLASFSVSMFFYCVFLSDLALQGCRGCDWGMVASAGEVTDEHSMDVILVSFIETAGQGTPTACLNQLLI